MSLKAFNKHKSQAQLAVAAKSADLTSSPHHDDPAESLLCIQLAILTQDVFVLFWGFFDLPILPANVVSDLMSFPSAEGLRTRTYDFMPTGM